ncbi:MAG: hypothetical protein IPI65_16475 [Bacteroidetes bacterium]|nr:hypothetical protein [Bacteroidota bacterium]
MSESIRLKKAFSDLAQWHTLDGGKVVTTGSGLAQPEQAAKKAIQMLIRHPGNWCNIVLAGAKMFYEN